MWALHKLCKAYGQRPSAVFGIEDAWLAWDFDQAVSAFGAEVEQRQRETKKDGSPRYATVRELLNLPKEPMRMKPVSKSMLMSLAGNDGY